MLSRVNSLTHMVCSPPSSSGSGISQAKIQVGCHSHSLRGSSQPSVSPAPACGWIHYHCTTWSPSERNSSPQTPEHPMPGVPVSTLIIVSSFPREAKEKEKIQEDVVGWHIEHPGCINEDKTKPKTIQCYFYPTPPKPKATKGECLNSEQFHPRARFSDKLLTETSGRSFSTRHLEGIYATLKNESSPCLKAMKGTCKHTAEIRGRRGCSEGASQDFIQVRPSWAHRGKGPDGLGHLPHAPSSLWPVR